MATAAHDRDGRPHVVIVGGGFGGLTAAQSLERAPVRVTLVDRRNHHLFQPLLYQVAMAGLSPADIAAPIRSVLRKQENVDVAFGDVTDIDPDRREVRYRADGVHTLTYDWLILATGAETAWFGNDEWARHALAMKSIDDAVAIRRRVLRAFEAADRESDPERRRRLLTFVVVGGGPTGVELAGALAELSRYVLARDYRRIGPADTRVLLVEAGPRILAGFPPSLSQSAEEQLGRFCVEVRTGAPVDAIDATGVDVGGERIPTETVIWAAGVRATGLTGSIGAPLDRAGRVRVGPDCAAPGRPEVFVIGDAAAYEHTPDGAPLPGVSPVAMQQARHVARLIDDEARSGVLEGAPRPLGARAPFVYRDRGVMATIGRSAAVAVIGRWKLDGLVAWLLWTVVHVFFLIGFRNRALVMFQWIWSYVTYQRGARLITGDEEAAHRPAAGETERGSAADRDGGAEGPRDGRARRPRWAAGALAPFLLDRPGRTRPGRGEGCG